MTPPGDRPTRPTDIRVIAEVFEPRRVATGDRAGTGRRADDLARGAWPSRLSPLAFPVVVGVLSRLFSTALLVLIPSPTRLPPILAHQSTSPFVAWDGQWYLHIASTGYHAIPQQLALDGGRRYDFAFYPVWPALVHVGTLLGLPPDLVGVVLANALFVAALALVFLVLADRFGAPVARGSVLLLAFAPAAYVASMAYSEPAFLAVVAGYFALRGSRYRPVAAVLTVLTRVTGLAVLASAIAAAIRDRAERPRLLASAAAILAGFAAWWGVVGAISRRPDGWLHGSPAWLPVAGVPDIARELGAPQPYELAWMAVVLLMVGLSVVLLRRDVELGVYSLAAIGMSVLGAPVSSMPRHTLVAFPAFAVLAGRLGPRGTALAAAGFAVLQVVFVWAAFGPPLKPP